ncbi:hypothetical protein HNQ00_003307 [Flavobacterium sp. 14A]|nr:hypothetical protein [Flavobacterium sp. 14A]
MIKKNKKTLKKKKRREADYKLSKKIKRKSQK